MLTFIASLFFANFVLTDTFRFFKIKAVDCIVNLIHIKFKIPVTSEYRNLHVHVYWTQHNKRWLNASIMHIL